MIRDTRPDDAGVVERDGVGIHYQVFGEGEPAVLLMPTWSIVHSDFWRHQVPHLMERHRVVVFDGRGNGASDRPANAAAYAAHEFAADAVAVMDAVRVERAVLAAVSAGAAWQLIVAGEHPSRVLGSIFIGASLPLGQPLPERVESLSSFGEPRQSYEGWWKFNRHYWLQDWGGFLDFFFAKCFTEPGSDQEIAHFVSMGHETTAATILLTTEAPGLDRESARQLAARVKSPVLVIHGDQDAISSVSRGQELAEVTGGELVVMAGAGHEPQSRWPAEVNRMIDEFLQHISTDPA